MTSKKLPFSSVASNYKFCEKPGIGDRRPKRTFTEICDELGVTKDAMHKRMKTSPVPPPKPALQTHSGLWYEPHEFRAWHKAHLAALEPAKV